MAKVKVKKSTLQRYCKRNGIDANTVLGIRFGAREYAKEHILGKTVTIFKNITVEFTWQGLKHDIESSFSNYYEKLYSVVAIMEIVKNAKTIKEERDKNNENLIVYKLISNVEIDDEDFDVWIVLKKHKTEKIFFYDHSLLLK